MKTKLFSKIFICLLIGLIYHPAVDAQTNLFPASGKVGIGTITPLSQLEIATPAITGTESLMKLRVSDAANDYLEIINSTAAASVFMPLIKGNVVSTNLAALSLLGVIGNNNDTGTSPIIAFDSRLDNSKINNRPLFGWLSYGTRYMTMLANGNLGIGIDNPLEKLAVNGKIRAKEIKVENANWPDYVFAKDYKFPSLEETEKHINEKGHLQGIPSAEEVKTNGVDLGAMNAKLLEKIEELTLILIHLNKKVEQQSVILEKQQKQLNKLK